MTFEEISKITPSLKTKVRSRVSGIVFQVYKIFPEAYISLSLDEVGHVRGYKLENLESFTRDYEITQDSVRDEFISRLSKLPSETVDTFLEALNIDKEEKKSLSSSECLCHLQESQKGPSAWTCPKHGFVIAGM